jgi:predicted dehydrogenase
MKKVKIGVFGTKRGAALVSYCNNADNAELVAICGYNDFYWQQQKKLYKDKNITFYESFDEFINHDMDAVVLANYADEHAEYAIKCLQKGKHVLSELLPVQTMGEAVRLVEAVEKSDKLYAYAENCCYMPAPKEMRKKYQEGLLGDFEYGEGEYLHNCESIWHKITQGDPDHWRNRVYATFYCTHSIGPLLYITGLRPKKVVGIEMPFNERMYRMGYKGGWGGIEMITLENGSVIKSIHAIGCSRNSSWYSIYGTKGRMESAREDAGLGGVQRLYINCDDLTTNYIPTDKLYEKAKEMGHGGSDYYIIYNFVEKILGNDKVETIDVYSALDMFLPGMFAYRSILKGGITLDVPDLRNKAQRDIYRNDNICVNPKIAGTAVIPSYSKGDMNIPSEVYENVRKNWEKYITENK